MTVYAASLRVYEPLAAFPPERQEHWRELAQSGRALDRLSVAAAEHRVALAGLVGSVPAADEPEALIVAEDGALFVCPLDLPRRRAEALEEFREGLPPVVADAFVPQAVADRMIAAYDAWRDGVPEAPAHVQTARWQVPLRWFVAFEPAERQLVLGPRAERYAAVGAPAAADLARAVAYRTAMSRARRRVARALAVLRRTMEDGPVTAGVEDLGRWLEEFHPHALVELDYGGLVHLFDDDALQADTSVADIAAAVEALGRGDAVATTAAYEQVMSRWRPIAATESAN